MEKLVQITRFEALDLHKNYNDKNYKAQIQGQYKLAEKYSEKSEYWLEISRQIQYLKVNELNVKLSMF